MIPCLKIYISICTHYQLISIPDHAFNTCVFHRQMHVPKSILCFSVKLEVDNCVLTVLEAQPFYARAIITIMLINPYRCNREINILPHSEDSGPQSSSVLSPRSMGESVLLTFWVTEQFLGCARVFLASCEGSLIYCLMCVLLPSNCLSFITPFN